MFSALYDTDGLTHDHADVLIHPSAHYSFYNANAATTLFSVRQGGSGFSGICANFYPQLVSWLCANPDAPEADELQTFIAVAENVIMYKCVVVLSLSISSGVVVMNCSLIPPARSIRANVSYVLLNETLYVLSGASRLSFCSRAFVAFANARSNFFFHTSGSVQFW